MQSLLPDRLASLKLETRSIRFFSEPVAKLHLLSLDGIVSKTIKKTKRTHKSYVYTLILQDCRLEHLANKTFEHAVTSEVQQTS